MGRVELAVLVEAGLQRHDTLLDFGCGSGRLALHAVPYLADGHYIGTDISPTMVARAADALRSKLGVVPAAATFLVQTDENFPSDGPVDVIAAFSVFTHMEPEDTFRYLAGARAVGNASTRLVLSCLPLDLEPARTVFRTSAALSLEERWRQVRNITTSRDHMTAIAAMAGWDVVTWLPGDQPCATLPDGSPAALGQTVAVLTLTA
jgi:cyclopropane fatty-acyl-phospholipid synthase-like methyltransferase